MNELITLSTDTKFPVSGRDLHERLEAGTEYRHWFPRMCEYGFAEDIDYRSKMTDRSDGLPGRQRIDHDLTISMAKEICMLQRTEMGRTIRRYLIAVEEQWNQPEAVMARALQMANDTIAKLNGNVLELSAA